MNSRWLNALADYARIWLRLRQAVVERQPAVRCITQWDGSDALFYCDPPYVGTEGYYDGAFGEKEHRELAEVLNAVRAQVVLSYYACDLVEQLYPAPKWYRKAIESQQTASGNRRRDRATKAQARGEAVKRTELVLTNFEPLTRLDAGHGLLFGEG